MKHRNDCIGIPCKYHEKRLLFRTEKQPFLLDMEMFFENFEKLLKFPLFYVKVILVFFIKNWRCIG